ncbi:nitroreductase [Candidatus Roizmanbacteria bacterium]|nr:nitroreductase [Candidatus Roizmanbacteria bacterium]
MITTQDLIKLKQPDTSILVSSPLSERFSPRVYASDPIPENDLMKIFEAARWSPSAMNAQPWFFYYAVRGTKSFDLIAQTLMQGNEWATQAPLLIVACYITQDESKYESYAKYDLGQAVLSLVLQAQLLGYHGRQMAGFNKLQLLESLQLPP